jgi:hypothetical protein
MRRSAPGSAYPFALTVLFVVLAAASRAWCGGVVEYHAASGSLPETQGWTYINLAPGVPAPVDSLGVLHPRATGLGDTRWWQRNDVPIAFRDGFEMDIALSVVSSTYVPNVGDGTQRSGFYFEAIDSLGRRLTLGVASQGLTVNTDLTLHPTNGIPLTASPVSGGLHLLQVRVASDSAVLAVDGSRQGACALGPAVSPGSANNVYFGDGSGGGASEVEIVRVRYGNFGTTDVADRSAAAAERTLRIQALVSPARGGVDFLLRSGRGGGARVCVVDLTGRRRADLGEFVATPTGTRIHWDGSDQSGRTVEAGVYFVRAEGNAGKASTRAIVLH